MSSITLPVAPTPVVTTSSTAPIDVFSAPDQASNPTLMETEAVPAPTALSPPTTFAPTLSSSEDARRAKRPRSVEELNGPMETKATKSARLARAMRAVQQTLAGIEGKETVLV